jgi:hypothetical protein
MMVQTERKDQAIAQQYERYKLERAAKQEEEQKIKQCVAEEAEKRRAYFAAKKPNVSVTRKPHVCAGCNKEIPTGSQVTTSSVIRPGSSVYGANGHWETLYYCQSCRPIKEA